MKPALSYRQHSNLTGPAGRESGFYFWWRPLSAVGLARDRSM